MFAGLWRIDSVGRDSAVTCPVTGQTGVEVNLYGMTRLDTLRQLEGRLRIEWGQSTRQWWQVASQQDKAIVAIADEPAPPFPGWTAFRTQVDGLAALPEEWRAILTAARGVYLLVLRRNGQQYIGSAIGAGGFLSRWTSYAADGHGGNVMLRGNKPEDYDVCVIEAASSSATDADILALEAAWKAKLGSRAFGLNAN